MVSTQRKITDSLRVYNTFWDIGNMPIKCLSVHIYSNYNRGFIVFLSYIAQLYRYRKYYLYSTTNLLVVIPREPFKISRCFIHTTLCLLYTLEGFESHILSLLFSYKSLFFVVFVQAANKPYTVLYCKREGAKVSGAL